MNKVDVLATAVEIPFTDATFDTVFSTQAIEHVADGNSLVREANRVLKAGGRLLVAVPAADDLVELRAAVLGEPVLKDRLESAAARLAGDFALEARRTVRGTARLGPGEIRDALAATYRGGRESRRERIAELQELEVTLSHELASFRRPG